MSETTPETFGPRPFEDTDTPAGWHARFQGEQYAYGYPLNSSSIIYEAERVVKSGPGTLYGFSVYNSNASAQFVLVFDADGTGALTSSSVPRMVYNAQGSSTLGVYWGVVGRAFSRGIIIANSSTGPTFTAGSADCWFDAQYV